MAALAERVRARRRDVSWALADRLSPIEVGDPSWRPSEEDKQHWRDHGWVLIRGSVDPALIDGLKREIQHYRTSHSSQTTNSKTGEGLRIGLLHAAVRTAREVGLNHQARTFLKWAFDDEPVLFGSLTFDIGSEQEPHIDAAFFYTLPETSMAGVWTAFEDIHADSGPLFYVDGSHTWPRLKAADALAGNAELTERVRAFRESGAREPDMKLSDDVYKAYIGKLETMVGEGTKLPAMLDKGDVFIWHPWLVHGGLPRVNRELTRRSMVVHYIGSKARMWDQHSFFLHGDDIASVPSLVLRIGSSRGRPYVWHPAPVNFSMGDGHFEA